MASASDFLKKRTAARQQAESIQSSDKTPLGKNDDGTVTRASNFLRNKAAERRAVIDQQYGKDAYGGSGRYEADKAQGFNSWLESVNGLSSQLGSDYQSRDGKFQSAADFGKYRDDNDARISVMQNRANAYRTYFQDNREIYGEDAVNGVLSTLDQGSKYLEELRGGLNSEYDFWSQFKDENDYNTYQRGKEYAALAEKPDFAEKSQYKSTANGQEKFNAWSGTYSNSGFDDIAYDYINRNEEARSRQMLSDIQSNASLLGLDNSERREMTDDEIATFNYLYAQDTANGDAEHKNAYAYIDYLTGDLNYRQRAKAEEEWAAYAKEHPVGSSAFSVLESPLKGLSYLGQAADYLSDGEIDQNAGYNKFSYINSAIRNEVNTIVEDNWGGVGSFAYQTGMSMGDFLLNTAITGGNQALSLAIMGTGAAADATISAKDRGLSDNQAFALGTIAGAAEIITEKVSLDALLDKTTLTKSAMGYFLKNTLAEGSEEVGSDIINLVADVLISKDKSEWRTSIDAYEAEGMTEKEAFWRAVRDQAENMGLDFLGGAVSGGVMSGAGIAINAGLNEYGARRTGSEFQAMGDDVVQATIQEGLASDPSTQSYKLAVQLQQKLDAGQTLTNAEIGRLYQANVQAIDAEDGSGDLLLRAAEEVTQKGRVTNNTAIDILSNPTAINTLTQEAGLNISEDMSKSQQRKAVKNAVATLARTQSDVSVNARETTPTTTETQQAATQETVRPAMQVEQQRPAAQQAYDIRRVRDAAASLGENGAKALSASYDGSVRADDYYAGFASYYEAGISGIDMDKVQSRYAAQLNQAQRFAAYSAGQNDAAASLALEREGVKSATVYGDEAGFVQSEHSASLPKGTVRFYDSLARAAGVKIQMAEATGKGGANGWYSNGIIHIANDAENPGTVVAKHEITHRMQEMAPEAYRKYRDYAMSALTERDGSTASIVEQYKSRYAEAGVNLSTEQAMDEIAADFTEALTVDPARFETLAKENRSVARKLLDAVRDFIRKVKSLFKGNKTAQNQAAANAYGVSIDTLEEAARLWEEALKATSEQTANKNAAQTDGGTKFSIKRTSQMTLAQQLKMFYDGKMASSDAFYFGVTPAVLEKSGFDALPLAMTIGDFRKSTQKKHNIPRRVLKNLMGNLASPLFSFGSGDRAGIVLNDIDGDGYTLLAALERGTDMDRKPVNVINSLYGLEHPAEWIKNQIDSGNEFVLYDEKRANAFLQTYGYMASVGDGIRSTGESVTQNGAEVKTKFSLKTPVEETDKLLALHNKDENSILAAIKLGGLPMPSIAIVKARDGHTKYGPISLVFSKDTIDPQLFRANKVYGGDAWTPTAPRVDYPVNSKKASQAEHELHRLAGDVSVAGGIFGNGAALRSMGIDDTSTRSTAELAEKLASTDTVRAAYLADQGKSLEPVKMDKVWDKFGNDTLQKVVDRLGVNTLAEIEANLETGESVKDALGENAEVIRDILRDYYREQGEPMLRRMAVKRHWTDAEINERRQTRIDNSMDGVSIFTLEDIVHHAWDMYQDGGATKGEIDRMATSDALRSAVDDHAVEEWIAGKLDGLLGEAGIYNGKDPYTPSGNLRSFSQLHYAYTLENIVKAMKEGQEERGGNTWGASAKTLQSVATPEYRSIQEIKADSGRLGMDEGAEYEAKLQAIDDQIGSIITKIKQGNKAHSDNSFVESDIIGSILMETSKGKRTVDAIMRAFSKEGYKISSQTAQDIQAVYQAAAEMPTGYFEAKPQRAVGFDEVLAAVIPDDSSKKLRDGLEQAGVRMLEYKTGDDADRLAKINSVEGARFSLKGRDILQENAALQEENRLLREQMKDYIAIQRRNGKLQESRDYWQGQTRRTQRVTTDKKAVTAAAKQLIQNYGADIAVKDIQGDLQSLYDYIASGYDGKDELTYTEARRRAEDIAETLVSNAVAVDSDMYDAYSDLRDYLRTTKIIYGKEYHGDIADYGDFRKRQFGRLNLGSEGHTNIDQVYQELSSRWPEFFSEQEQTHPTDQLLHIVEVLDGISKINEYNPFSRYMDQAVTGAANEIMETFFDLPQTRKTFADRQALKLENAKAKGREQVQKVREQYTTRLAELREQNRQRVQNAIAKERETRERQMGALKDRYAAKDAAGRERRAARELRAKITRHASALSQKLLRPSDQHHIPEAMRGPVAAMLESINQESQYSIDPETGKQAKNADGDPTKRTEAFRALREQYEAISKGRTDFDGVVDPGLLDNLAEVISMKNVRLADMSVNQLATVWQTVRAIEQSISTANKLLGKSRFAGVLELADAIRQSSATKRTKGNWRGPAGWGDRLLNLDMMNPLTFLHQFGAGGDALYRELQEARDNRTSILAETVDQAQKAVGKADVEALRKKTHTFHTEGGELKLTTAQLMALYELNKRKQAQDHIYKGGIRATAQDSGVSRSKTARENLAAALGKVDAPAAGVKVSQADVAAMLSELTEEEIKIADGLQAIMQGYLAQEGNRESMKVYGYQKFTEKDYFPISSDPHQVMDKIGDVLEGGGKRPRSIAEWGSAKGTVDKANNGLLLGDIFDVFAQHAVDMATYASHLGVMEDMNRVRNFTFRDGEGNRTGTMGDIIQRVTGQGGTAYLNKLLQDVGAGTAKDSVTGLAKLTANYKAASVGLNMRVALQQPTSYLRAAAVLDPKYLADPRVLKKGGWEKALKNAPIARWKDWGNFEINQGRQIQDLMFNTDSKLDRARNFSMKLAGAMDSLTWGRIWNACELEVMDKRPSLTRGSAAFNEAVAQRFTDVVDQTQVVDNVLGRSQIMRSGDNLAKMATSYMGEPTQSYNLVYRAFRDWSQEQDNAKRTAAKKRLGRAVVALTASQFANAIAQALWDAVRDDEDRDKKYWERVLGNILPNFADNANPVGMVPYLKDIVSVMQGYDVKRMDMEAITSFISACQNMSKAINGEGRYTLAGASANLIAETARIFGLPAATVKRDLVAIARSVGVETGDWYFQYQLEKALNSVGYSGNRGEFYDIAFGALQDGEMDVYQRITQDLMEQGVKAKTIESAMRDRLKAAQEEDESFTISQEARDLIGSRDKYAPDAQEEDDGFTAESLDAASYQRYATQRAANYREMADTLEGYDTFARLDDEVKDKVLEAAYTLADKTALAANSGGQYEADTKWMLWATGGAEHGVDETEALLFKAAYDMTEGDKDENGKTVSGSKKENVLEAAAAMMPWLTAEELDYLKSNYWKS